ncbi:hypothetical protein MHY_03180 [Megamonas hypermegale ART12/1]|nr:hypothetical protein MHY_03180 [Megamonas hypermegale ART12/1]
MCNIIDKNKGNDTFVTNFGNRALLSLFIQPILAR